jgi:putative glutamine amidotransferase
MGSRRPIVGVMCCNEQTTRPIQAVATRFVRPLSDIAGASVLLVPAVADAVDAPSLADTLDGLLLTGSRSNVAGHRYAGATDADEPVDEERDEVALRMGAAMIDRGRPVFGICRGMQEINVLFGGTLSREACGDRHLSGAWDDHAAIFAHRHDVVLTDGGLLSRSIGHRRITVNSIHEQGVARLGSGLRVEAIAPDDGLVEAVAADAGDAAVLAVQWHPECDLEAPAGASFFTLLGAALRGAPIHSFSTRGLQ